MNNLNWQKQTLDSPLFEDIIWEKPENKLLSGKYLIVGGNSHEITSTAQIYENLTKVGSSNILVAIPNTLKKLVDHMDLKISYLPSNPSGSIGLKATAELLDLANQVDITIIAQDLGKNSETVLTLEHFLAKNTGLLCFTSENIIILEDLDISLNEKILLVTSFSNLQKLLSKKYGIIIKKLDELYVILNTLKEFNIKHPVNIVCVHEDIIIVVSEGRVSTTKIPNDKTVSIELLSASASFYMVNYPTKTYQAISSAVYEALKN